MEKNRIYILDKKPKTEELTFEYVTENAFDYYQANNTQALLARFLRDVNNYSISDKFFYVLVDVNAQKIIS